MRKRRLGARERVLGQVGAEVDAEHVRESVLDFVEGVSVF